MNWHDNIRQRIYRTRNEQTQGRDAQDSEAAIKHRPPVGQLSGNQCRARRNCGRVSRLSIQLERERVELELGLHTVDTLVCI